MPNWLRTGVLTVIGSICLLALVEYTSCVFFENPRAWRTYIATQGKFPDKEHNTCKDVDEETIAALTGVLATLLALGTSLKNDNND